MAEGQHLGLHCRFKLPFLVSGSQTNLFLFFFFFFTSELFILFIFFFHFFF